MTRLSWDIFCTVIDNYGDIGTTWRLAQLLAHQHGQQVRLWVDDLHALQPLVPDTQPHLPRQALHGIEVCHWSSPFPATPPAQVVIEAFGCTLPEHYLHAMRQQPPVWINLEYFSAEDWVAGCHQMPSLQASGLNKFFFFPGITPGTGGLLRENDLLARRDAFINRPDQQHRWCQQWHIPQPRPDSLTLSLFGYENAALPQLLNQLARHPTAVDAYLPVTRLLPSAQPLFPAASLTPGSSHPLGQLQLHILPFLPQREYDALLWLCDVNFVRGEESLTRALWAGTPFIWHIYPTEDDAHWHKLDAFLRAWHLHSPADVAQTHRDLMHAWNRQQLNHEWHAFHQTLSAQRQHHQQQLQAIMALGELSQNLVNFAQSKV